MNSELLSKLLDNNGFEDVAKEGNVEVWAEWLNDDDNRKEPTTVEGMLNRLGLKDLKAPLTKALSLGLCTALVDDRALIVRVEQ